MELINRSNTQCRIWRENRVRVHKITEFKPIHRKIHCTVCNNNNQTWANSIQTQSKIATKQNKQYKKHTHILKHTNTYQLVHRISDQFTSIQFSTQKEQQQTYTIHIENDTNKHVKDKLQAIAKKIPPDLSLWHGKYGWEVILNDTAYNALY